MAGRVRAPLDEVDALVLTDGDHVAAPPLEDDDQPELGLD
jgi:hypothetical protein